MRLLVDVFALRAAEILAFERVEVVTVTTGARFQTGVAPAPRGRAEGELPAGRATRVRRAARNRWAR